MDYVDRRYALALINNFSKKYAKTKNSVSESKITASIMSHYLGGSTRHWGNILYNNELPTRLDIQCLRAALELTELEDVRSKSITIRQMQKYSEHPKNTGVPAHAVKEPVRRRDGSVYNGDEWNWLYGKLDEMLRECIKEQHWNAHRVR